MPSPKKGHQTWVGDGDSGLPPRGPEARRGRPTLEEERNRHLKDLGNVLQAAGADAIGALLVFLDLLECQAKGVGNIGLTHIEHETAHAQAAADVLVYRIENASGHRITLNSPGFYSIHQTERNAAKDQGGPAPGL